MQYGEISHMFDDLAAHKCVGCGNDCDCPCFGNEDDPCEMCLDCVEPPEATPDQIKAMACMYVIARIVALRRHQAKRVAVGR